MKRAPLIIAAALLVSLPGCGGEEASEAESAWLSWEEGMAMAAKTGRPVVVDFYTSWCRWCKVMERETFADPRVDAYLAGNFVTIRVNAEKRSGALRYGERTYTPAGLAKAFEVRGYPSLAYLDEDGKLIFVDPGFKKPDRFMTVLRYVRSGCYRENVSLGEFARRGGCD